MPYWVGHMVMIVAILGFVLSLSAGPIYHVTTLGSAGGQRAGASDISNAGAAAGNVTMADGRGFAATWAEADVSLFGPGATGDAINFHGAIAGTSIVDGVRRATVWQDGNARHVGDGDASYGLGINDNGDLTGQIVRDGRPTAFVQRLGVLIDIPTPGIWSSAYDISNTGIVAGYLQKGVTFEAFTWSSEAGVRRIGGLGGSSYAMAVNDAGVVVGSSVTRSGYLHAFLYDGLMHDLGTLGGRLSAAYGVNAGGHAVGYSYDAQGRQRAFVWYDGMMWDLNALIDPEAGWTLEAAYGINDYGQIVGEGVYAGARMAFALNPMEASDAPVPDAIDTPEPGAALLFLSGLAVVGGIRAARFRRKRKR